MNTGYKYVPIFEHTVGAPKISRMSHEELPSMLRARTALAFLHHHKLFMSSPLKLAKTSKFADINNDFQIWHPKAMTAETLNGWQQMYLPYFERELATDEVGGLLIAESSTANFADQSFTMVLWEDLLPEDLKQAFEPSMRWLNDRKSNLRVLENMWLHINA